MKLYRITRLQVEGALSILENGSVFRGKGAILNAAIVSDVDIILTGDKDFLSLDMEHPKCMTVAQFLESEGVEE